MSKRLKIDDKIALQGWEDFVESIAKETTIEENLSYAEREAKRKELEKNPIAWMYYFFPNYAKSEFADFQKKRIKELTTFMEWYGVLSWSRELAKSTIIMMVIFFLVLTGKKRNILLVSDSKDNAERLLEPYKGNLEANQRIQYFYGKQVGARWTDGEFITKKKAAFRALGAGQSPRGTRNDAVRPDVIICDDFDTDKDTRNPEIIDKKWKWFEEALYFTRSISAPLLTIWCGNIIAEDCCVVRAGNKAKELSKRDRPLGHWDIKNLRMVNVNKPNPEEDFKRGTSVWPQKNSEEQIDIVLSQTSSVAAQKECFNNPVTTGKIFAEMHYARVPPLKKFKFLVLYGDPAPSNTKNKASSYKGLWLIGGLGGKFYVINGVLDHMTNYEFVEYYYKLRAYVGNKTAVYYYIENNKLQDPFYKQVMKPLFKKIAKNLHEPIISIKPDGRDKPDKFSRIEANLEPKNRDGLLYLNEDEQDNPHMKLLVEQFKAINPKLTFPADGPDSVEGGVWVVESKLQDACKEDWQSWGTPSNKNRI
ncbi:MAG: hypothetical protein ACK5MG_02610 [Bacteroidales bacterium]